MSLINDMLKDIDARQAAQRQGAVRARRLVAGAGMPTRHGWLAPLLGVVVVLLLAAVGWLLFNRPGVSPTQAVVMPAPTAVPARSPTAPAQTVAVAPVVSVPAAPIAAASEPASARVTISEAGTALAEQPPATPVEAAPALPPTTPSAAKSKPAPGRVTMSETGTAVAERPPATPAEAAPALPPRPAAAKSEPALVPDRPLASGVVENVRPASAPGVFEKTSRAPTSTQQAERLTQEAYGLLRSGRTGDAEGRFRDALGADPRHRPAREGLAGMLATAGRWVELRIAANEGLAADPGHGTLAQLGAHAALEQDDAAAAIALLERAAGTAPQETGFHVLLAATYQRAGRFAESANLYQRLVMTDPQQATWWAGFAIALDGLGRTAEARDAYRNALARGGLTPQLQAYARERLGAPN